jgi:hypothetical protein
VTAAAHGGEEDMLNIKKREKAKLAFEKKSAEMKKRREELQEKQDDARLKMLEMNLHRDHGDKVEREIMM